VKLKFNVKFNAKLKFKIKKIKELIKILGIDYVTYRKGRENSSIKIMMLESYQKRLLTY